MSSWWAVSPSCSTTELTPVSEPPIMPLACDQNWRIHQRLQPGDRKYKRIPIEMVHADLKAVVNVCMLRLYWLNEAFIASISSKLCTIMNACASISLISFALFKISIAFKVNLSFSDLLNSSCSLFLNDPFSRHSLRSNLGQSDKTTSYRSCSAVFSSFDLTETTSLETLSTKNPWMSYFDVKLWRVGVC